MPHILIYRFVIFINCRYFIYISPDGDKLFFAQKKENQNTVSFILGLNF